MNANIAGLIVTPFDQPVSEVTLKGRWSAGNIAKEFNGNFEFTNLRIGDDYKVTALVDKNYLDGVSTMDIVKIPATYFRYQKRFHHPGIY